MAKVIDNGITYLRHFIAYKGVLMVNDEMYSSFTHCVELGILPLAHATNGDSIAQ